MKKKARNKGIKRNERNSSSFFPFYCKDPKFTLQSNLSAKLWLIISYTIKLIQHNIYQILSIVRYFSLMITLTFLILVTLSDMIVVIQLGSIFSIISEF